MKSLSYFPSLIYQSDVPDGEDVNKTLTELIAALRNVDESGIQKSNRREVGGWHSRAVLHKLPEFDDIVTRIHGFADSISKDLHYDESRDLRISSMWAIVNPPGAFNLAHIHPGCLWSGVYYVKAPKESGRITFTDPRVVNIMNKPRYAEGGKVPKKCWTKVHFTPTPGRMLMFPSWLYHSVGINGAASGHEDGSDGDRVIVSFNLNQVKKR